MPGRLEHTAERAHHLVETGELAAARAVLREALAVVEPDPAQASPCLATAAMLYARVLVALGEPGTARRWAAYAHTASRRLFGTGDERTRQAASVLAGVLHRAGAYSRSAHLYRDLIRQLSAVDAAQALAAGPTWPRCCTPGATAPRPGACWSRPGGRTGTTAARATRWASRCSPGSA